MGKVEIDGSGSTGLQTWLGSALPRDGKSPSDVTGTGEGAPPSVLVLLPAVFFQSREMADTQKHREQPEDQRERGRLRYQNNGIVLSGEG